METVSLLKKLKRENKITTQAYKTYMGQISSGDEIACIKGMKNKKLITEEKAKSLIESYMLGYTEQRSDIRGERRKFKDTKYGRSTRKRAQRWYCKW